MLLDEWSRNTVLLTSTQATIKGTTQYSVGDQSQLSTVRDQLSIGPDRYPSGSRVAHSFGSDKLYIVLSNKCFKCIQCICCGIDIRPSQDHRILRVQTVRINLASIYI